MTGRYKRGAQCFYAVLRNMLAYYGYGYSESELFFLLGGWNPHTNEKYDNITIQRLAFSSYIELMEEARDTFDLNIYMHQSKQDRFSIEKALAEKIPVILAVRPHSLDYHIVQTDILNVHFILLEGLADNGQAIIWDGYVQDVTGYIDRYHGLYGYEKLMANMDGYAVVTPMGTGIKNYARQAIAGIAADGMKKMIGLSPGTRVIGINAVLAAFSEIFAPEGLKQASMDMYSGLILTLKTRFIIIYEYTETIMRQYGMGYDYALFDEIKLKWNSLFLRMMLGNDAKYAHGNARKIYERCEEILDMHKKMYEEIIDIIGCVASP